MTERWGASDEFKSSKSFFKHLKEAVSGPARICLLTGYAFPDSNDLSIGYPRADPRQAMELSTYGEPTIQTYKTAVAGNVMKLNLGLV